DLLRLDLLHLKQKVLAWIPLDIELAIRELVIEQSADFGQVTEADMPLVRPWMYRQSMRSRLQCNAAKARNTWPWQVTAVAQHGDSIQIDGECCRHGKVPVTKLHLPLL